MVKTFLVSQNSWNICENTTLFYDNYKFTAKVNKDKSIATIVFISKHVFKANIERLKNA